MNTLLTWEAIYNKEKWMGSQIRCVFGGVSAVGGPVGYVTREVRRYGGSVYIEGQARLENRTWNH
jgi:hypothetical protein